MLTSKTPSSLSAQFQQAVKSLKSRDLKGFARLLSEIERLGPVVLAEPALLNPSGNIPLRIGITGPPGAGKSTLINCLIREFRRRNLSVGVLAVDPSSPFTQGAILGDRIRFNEFHEDSKVFIRSVGTRGSLGGLCGTAYLMLRAFDAFGFDVVLIETVGVGQTELEIVNVADVVAVVLVPESGDSIQAMKAGLIEIADGFIVNKSDRPGAESLSRDLMASLGSGESLSSDGNSMDQGSQKAIPIFRTVATEAKGITEIVDWMSLPLVARAFESDRSSPARLQAEARALLRLDWESKIADQAAAVSKPAHLQKLFR